MTARRGRKPGGMNREKPPGPPLPPPMPAPRATVWTQKSDYQNVLELWFSVVRLAVVDMSARSADDRTAARRWALDTRRHVQSCHWVCDVLNISHEAFVSACLSRDGRARILRESDGRGQFSYRHRRKDAATVPA